MSFFIKKNSFLLLLLLLLSACSEEKGKRLAVIPNSYGRIDNILFVADKYNWSSMVGDTFKYHFEAAFPVTPQPEGLYDIRFKQAEEFLETKILKTHRSIIIMGALDDPNDKASNLIRKTLGEDKVKRAETDTSYRIAIQHNRWAQDQTVVYWFAPTRNQLIKSIDRDYEIVIKAISQADNKKMLQQIYAAGSHLELVDEMADTFNFSLKVPRAYYLANRDSTSMWFRKETDKVSSNIFICTLPLNSSTEVNATNFKKLRNKITKDYFSTWIDDSYMEIEDSYLPVYYQPMRVHNCPTLQARGLWKIVNDFMGGSFVSYMIEDKANARVIFLDGFVHAPGQKKRPLLRQLDMIFSTLQLLDE